VSGDIGLSVVRDSSWQWVRQLLSAATDGVQRVDERGRRGAANASVAAGQGPYREHPSALHRRVHGKRDTATPGISRLRGGAVGPSRERSFADTSRATLAQDTQRPLLLASRSAHLSLRLTCSWCWPALRVARLRVSLARAVHGAVRMWRRGRSVRLGAALETHSNQEVD
jgi:hypothetical protein